MNYGRMWTITACLVVLILTPLSGRAQSLMGVQGLVTIPTAAMPDDGTLSVGYNFLNRPYQTLYPKKPWYDKITGTHHAHSVFASLVFLPFLDVTFRLTRPISPQSQYDYIGDRFVALRLLILKERNTRPALVIGAHDFIGSGTLFAAGYFAVLKTFPAVGQVHLGYGFDVTKLGFSDADRVQFQGVFGGIVLAPASFLNVVAEYDGQQLNAGIRVKPRNALHLLVGFVGLRTISAGLSYKLTLPHQ